MIWCRDWSKVKHIKGVVKTNQESGWSNMTASLSDHVLKPLIMTASLSDHVLKPLIQTIRHSCVTASAHGQSAQHTPSIDPIP
jgi:hypothetical protein